MFVDELVPAHDMTELMRQSVSTIDVWFSGALELLDPDHIGASDDARLAAAVQLTKIMQRDFECGLKVKVAEQNAKRLTDAITSAAETLKDIETL